MNTFAFRGENRHKIDKKGRVSIPADFRRIIEAENSAGTKGDGGSFTVVYGDKRLQCLKCFTESVISEIDRKIAGMDRASNKRAFLEYFFQTRSCKIQLDPSGRLVLSGELREKVGHGSIVCFAGKGDTFEIWNPEIYETHVAELEMMYWKGNNSVSPMSLIDSDGD